MVKLRRSTDNDFSLTVPLEKIRRKKWKGGELFDCEFDQDGNLRYVEIKK